MASSDVDTTRERIVDAAGEIFADKGYDATTIRDICQRAGANVAAVNYYFGDKQRLYIEAVVRAHRWRMEKVKLPEWSEHTPPREKLMDFILTFLRRVRSEPGDTWHTRLIMREIANPSQACAEMVQSSIRPQFEILTRILRQLLPERVSEERVRLVAFSIVGQCLFYHFGDPVIRHLLTPDEYGALTLERLAEHIAEFSLAAIESPAPSAQRPRVRR